MHIECCNVASSPEQVGESRKSHGLHSKVVKDKGLRFYCRNWAINLSREWPLFRSDDSCDESCFVTAC